MNLPSLRFAEGEGLTEISMVGESGLGNRSSDCYLQTPSFIQD